MISLSLNIQNRYFDIEKLYSNIFARDDLQIQRGYLLLKGYGEQLDLMSFLEKMDPLKIFTDLVLEVR